MQWPLDNRPEHYFQQGERFSDMLLMLLKMRNIPPKTETGPDDGILHPVDKSHEAASRWFDMIQLTSEPPSYPSFQFQVVANIRFQTITLKRGDRPTSIPWILGA